MTDSDSNALHLLPPSTTRWVTPPRRTARLRARLREETGAATAEYAVILLAAVGFAGLLLVILRGDDIKGMLTELVHRALTTAG
jgi:Flp pilus assembly pilin Flp